LFEAFKALNVCAGVGEVCTAAAHGRVTCRGAAAVGRRRSVLFRQQLPHLIMQCKEIAGEVESSCLPCNARALAPSRNRGLRHIRQRTQLVRRAERCRLKIC
jgi:hypothetical protein